MHLPQWPRSVQGHVLAGDVEAEKADTSVPGILIQHYLVFSLSQSLPPPSNQNNLKVFPFGKAACIVDVCERLTSDTQSARKHVFFFTWGLGCWLLLSSLFCLVRYTLDEFGTARRCAVVRGFIDALTRGGPGGTPRPIEMHSHDPMRYICYLQYELNIDIYRIKTKRALQFWLKCNYFLIG